MMRRGRSKDRVALGGLGLSRRLFPDESSKAVMSETSARPPRRMSTPIAKFALGDRSRRMLRTRSVPLVHKARAELDDDGWVWWRVHPAPRRSLS